MMAPIHERMPNAIRRRYRMLLTAPPIYFNSAEPDVDAIVHRAGDGTRRKDFCWSEQNGFRFDK
jgi:hypothetical protein